MPACNLSCTHIHSISNYQNLIVPLFAASALAFYTAAAAECKLLRKLNLRSTFYTDKDMLARFPLRPCGERNRHCDAVICPPGSRCALCGKKDREEDMTRTDCCDQVRTIYHTFY